jgi:hypothetical protein
MRRVSQQVICADSRLRSNRAAVACGTTRAPAPA